VSFHKNIDFLERHCFLCLTYFASKREDNLNKDDYTYLKTFPFVSANF